MKSINHKINELQNIAEDFYNIQNKLYEKYNVWFEYEDHLMGHKGLTFVMLVSIKDSLYRVCYCEGIGDFVFGITLISRIENLIK